jgi:hypothetical protein
MPYIECGRCTQAYPERVLLIVAQHDCGQRQHMRHLQLDRAPTERTCRTKSPLEKQSQAIWT